MKYLNFFKQHIDKYRIKRMLDSHHIRNYTINDDLTVDLNGPSYTFYDFIPVKLNRVSGDIHYMSEKVRNKRGDVGGSTLQYAPVRVDGNFICSGNPMKNLLGAPSYVGGSFICDDCDLETLEGAPDHVGRDFSARSNRLTNMTGGPKLVGGRIDLTYNHSFVSLEGFPEDYMFKQGNFTCWEAPFHDIFRVYYFDEFIHWLIEYDAIQGNEIIVDRFNMALGEFGAKIENIPNGCIEKIKKNYKFIY